VADPGEGLPPPRGAEKIFFGDRGSPLSKGLDDPPPPPTGTAFIHVITKRGEP